MPNRDEEVTPDVGGFHVGEPTGNRAPGAHEPHNPIQDHSVSVSKYTLDLLDSVREELHATDNEVVIRMLLRHWALRSTDPDR